MTTPTLQIKQDLDRKLEQIRSNGDLSAEAKRRYIADAYQKAEADYREAIETQEREIQERVEKAAQTKRAIIAMFFSEVARIRTSAPGQDGPHTTGTLIEEAARRVVTDQYPDLGEDVRATIVEGWTQSIRQFNRIDWLATIGRDAPGWINES